MSTYVPSKSIQPTSIPSDRKKNEVPSVSNSLRESFLTSTLTSSTIKTIIKSNAPSSSLLPSCLPSNLVTKETSSIRTDVPKSSYSAGTGSSIGPEVEISNTFSQRLSGESTLTYLNETQVAAYEQQIYNLVKSDSNTKDAVVTVIDQQLLTSSSGSGRKLQDDPKKQLILTYVVTVKAKDNLNALRYFEKHADIVAEKKENILADLQKQGVKVLHVETTINLGSLPSITPSQFLSQFPSQMPSLYDWKLDYIDGSAKISEDNSKVIIQFNIIPPFVTKDDIKISFLKDSCNMKDKPKNDIFKTSGADFFVNDNGKVTITIGLNEGIDLRSTGFWKKDEINNEQGLGFCVRTDLMDSNDPDLGDLSLGKHQTRFWLKYDFDVGFDTSGKEIKDVDADQADDAEKKFNLNACICENDKCINEAALELNQDFELCIYPVSDQMMVETVSSMTMRQKPNKKFRPVVRGKPNIVSHVQLNRRFDIGGYEPRNGVIIGSKAIPIFFDGPLINGKLQSIEIRGDAKLAVDEFYDQPNRRSLIQKVRSMKIEKTLTDGDDIGRFGFSVPLSTGTEKKDNSLMLITGLSIVILIILVAMLQKKRKRRK